MVLASGVRFPSLLLLSVSVLLGTLFPTASLATQSVSFPVGGHIVDPGGAVVAGAVVTLTSAGDPVVTHRTVSSSQGIFEFRDIPAGRHSLRIEVPGFREVAEDLMVDGQKSRPTYSLTIAGLAQSVTVRNAAPTSVARTDAPLRDQPLSVSTIGSDSLQTFAVNDLVVALQGVPNVNAFNQYGVYEYYSFRGFNDSVQTVDGVRNEGNRVRTQLSNVERVEVLKGPASVLYGSEAIGATVNIVLKKPTPDPVIDAALSFGSWQTQRATFGAGGRLFGSRVLYRIDVGADDSNNFRHDPATKINVTPTVSWRPGDRDHLEVRYSVNRNDLSGDGGIPVIELPDGTQAIPDVPRDRRYNTPQDFALSTDHNLRIGYTRAVGDNATLRATLSSRKYDDEYWVAESLSVTPPSQVNREFLYFKHARRPHFGQVETSARVHFGVQHDLLAGWEHQNYRTRTTRSNAASVETTPIDLYEPVETHVPHTDFTVSRYDYTRVIGQSAYLQDTFALGDRVKVVIGGRYDYLRRRQNNNLVSDGVETAVEPTRRTSRAFTSRVGLVYQPAEQLDLYAQHATAFRPDFNLQPDGSSIDPETGRQFEVGQRLRLFDARAEVHAALFHIEKRNIALARPGGIFDLAGQIRSRGAEAEVDLRPTALSRLSIGYGFTDAEYVDYATTAADFSGRARPRSPRHTFSASASLTFDNGIGVAASAQSRGRQFLNDANTFALDGYSLLNVSGSYTRGKVQLALTLSNLANAAYWASTLGNSQLYPGEPLRALVSVRVRTR